MALAVCEMIGRRVLFTAFVVDTLSDTAADAAGTPDGAISLREALTAANTDAVFGDAPAGGAGDDSITFARALAGRTLTLANGQLVVTDDVSVSGAVTLDANAASRVMKVTAAGRVLLSGLTLTGGRDTTADGGGAIHTAGTRLQIERCTISGNTAYVGGGIEAISGRVGLYRSVVENNTAAVLPGVATGPTPAYLALGDSITYGETDLRYLPSLGLVNGYPRAVVDELVGLENGSRPDLINLAIDGETAESFADDSGRTPPVVGRTDTPLRRQNRNYAGDTPVTQEQAFLANVRRQQRNGHAVKYVSITLGFNEIAALSTRPNGAALIDSTLAAYRTNYARVLTGITRTVPGAKLILLNYYNPFPADNNANPARAIFAAAGTRLNATIRSLADRFGATYVDTATPFVGNEAAYTYIDEVGAGDAAPRPFGPNDNGVTPIGNVHPNATGYGVIAAEVLDALTAGLPEGDAGDGGGVHVGGRATVAITRSTVRANAAAVGGGGVWAAGDATTIITGSVVAGNAAAAGGGVFSRGTLAVTASSVQGNAARGRRGSGGGVYLGVGGTATFTGARLTGNRASYRGGGVFAGGRLSAVDTDILFNRARTGGGVFTGGEGGVTLEDDVTVRGNLPDERAGAA